MRINEKVLPRSLIGMLELPLCSEATFASESIRIYYLDSHLLFINSVELTWQRWFYNFLRGNG